MSKLEIRPYTPADSEAVIHLHNVALEAVGAHVGNGLWDSDLLNIEGVYLENNGAFLVGLLDGQIVAMGALRNISDEKGEIKRMRVLPQFQRQGFGQVILARRSRKRSGQERIQNSLSRHDCSSNSRSKNVFEKRLR